ncbi:hypothetical protein HDV05_005608 [Chytridiales sp. JEL 0842]|nr:hypothetical protein HDV05_005608 [Chytridiales sp. JEL 0842]
MASLSGHQSQGAVDRVLFNGCGVSQFDLKKDSAECSKYSKAKRVKMVTAVNEVAGLVAGIPQGPSSETRLGVIKQALAAIKNRLGYHHYTTASYYEDLMKKVDNQTPAVLHVLQCPLYATYGLNDKSKIGLQINATRLVEEGFDVDNGVRYDVIPHFSSILRTIGEDADGYLGKVEKAAEEEEGVSRIEKKTVWLSVAILCQFLWSTPEVLDFGESMEPL